MLSGIDKGISKIVSFLVTVLLSLSCLFVSVYFLTGMNTTGADVAVGEVLGKTASDAGQYAIPALQNMGDPAWQEMKGYASGLLPSGSSEWGSVTINWDDMFSGDGQTYINGQPYTGGQDGSSANPNGDNSQNQQSTVQCAPSTPQSQAALAAWYDGDWETAAAQFQLTSLPNDCLAQSLATVFQPFDQAVRLLYGAENAQQFGEAVNRIKAMNPRYTAVYAAEAMAMANATFAKEPFSPEGKAFAGATISVVKIDYDTWGAGQGLGFMENEKDVFELKVVFQSPWEASYRLNRPGLEALEAVLGLEKGTLNAVDDTYTVPGSFVPANLPVPLLPSGVTYDPMSGSVQSPQSQAPQPQPEVVPTDTAAPATGQDTQAVPAGTKVCNWPGLASSGGAYLVKYLGVSQAEIEQLNPGLWALYTANPNEARQVIVPQSASCQ